MAKRWAQLALLRSMCSTRDAGTRDLKRRRVLAPQSEGGGGVTAVAPTGSGSSIDRGGTSSKAAAGGAMRYKEPGPGTINLGGGAVVRYATDLFTAEEAKALFAQLRVQLEWEQRAVRVMGRMVQQPRLIHYQADSSELQYTYSGATLQPSPWHPGVLALKARVEAAVGEAAPPGGFNSCLLNRYRSGQDSIAWHSDSEPLYGNCPTIASVSLGAPREFLLRRNADSKDQYRFRLGGGDLFVMLGSVQEGWRHSIPRRGAKANAGERISLTFRRIIVPERS